MQLALALLTEAAASPQGALVDAAVMASATDVGWGGGLGRAALPQLALTSAQPSGSLL